MPPIYLIPGLGADQRNYPDPWRELPNCNCLEWPEYHGKAAMPEVARFMAEAWKLPPGAILIGSSFGGILACEMAKFLPVHSLVLISSTTSRENVTSTGGMKLLTRVLPLRLVQLLLRYSQPIREKLWGRDPTPVAHAILDSIQMFASCQASFYRDMFQAMATWDGFNDVNVRPIRIHGKHDSVMLPATQIDRWLDGGHLIVMTHARECVEFIRAMLEQPVSGSKDESRA